MFIQASGENFQPLESDTFAEFDGVQLDINVRIGTLWSSISCLPRDSLELLHSMAGTVVRAYDRCAGVQTQGVFVLLQSGATKSGCPGKWHCSVA
jgi:hypothetical protein